jgi:CheY-like chemotaxis protein/HPt (histidine-containing phosphotransfer) domain-containing protein
LEKDSTLSLGKIISSAIPIAFSILVSASNYETTGASIEVLKAEEKNIAFKLNVDESIPNRVVGDPTRINQILINLAGNALKFTEKGFVEIKVTKQKTTEKKHLIQFDVIDSGIGIASDYVGKIFDSFTQAGTDVTRKFGGTGLGLTISKQLTELMGGDIKVASEIGVGTTFSVILPLKESEVQTAAVDNTIVDEQTMLKLNKVKLLLVEDNEFNRMVAEDTLKELIPGVIIDIAVNGEEAVNRVQQENYDVLLMDIQMPVMDGVTATRTIRTTLAPPACNVKIIAMTANVLQEDVKQYFDAGMNAYVSKPFQTDELLLKMAAVLENATGKPQPNETVIIHKVVAEPPPPSLPDQITDMQFLKQFTGGNDEKMHKYIGMFLENGPKLLNTIRHGLATKDFQAVKIAAHSMKPQLSYMGVKEDVSHIFIIEQSAGESAHFERLPALVNNLERVCAKAFEELRST